MASIARRYAQALLDALKSPEEIERVEASLVTLRTVLAGVPAMKRILLHPGFDPQKKKSLLDQALGGGDTLPAFRRFTEILIERRRLADLPAIADAFRKIKDRRQGTTSVEVTTTQGVTEPEQAGWEASLAKLTGGRVRIDYRTDTSLIGGAMARIGSVVYDGSVRGSLERIRQSLLGE